MPPLPLLLLLLLLPPLTALQVHTVSRDGSEAFLTAFDEQPSYAQLQEALKAWPAAASNKSLMERLRDEVQFIQDTAQPKQ
jgi:hypothetical protein